MVRVQPGAKRAGLKGRRADGALQVAVTAPAEGGRANRAVVEMLAEWLGIRPRQVRIARGAAARSKSVEIDGLEPAVLERRIAELGRTSEHGE